MTFENLNLIDPIRKALAEEGYTVPTPIQSQAIPIILERRDLVGCAQTGTGKTAAFAIPILQLLHADKMTNRGRRVIQALILTPTRELAIQIADSFAAYGRYTGLKDVVVFGGVSQKPQTDRLRDGVDILIATPGRLLDLMNQKYINLEQVKFFVLDEADRMLDMGFIHDVKKIITKLPVRRQSLFFSATMPPEIVKLASSILTNPKRVEVTPEQPTVEAIQQSLYYVSKANKKDLLLHILKDKAIESALVFTRTKHGADHVVRILLKAKVNAEAIHGNKSQNARQRALHNFKTKQTRVLVATDIAARGIDIDELSHVINFEIPNIPETYVHRIGRTGRAGLSGVAISFCDGEEKAFLKDINKLINIPIPVVEDHPFVLLPGERSPHVTPPPVHKTSSEKTHTQHKSHHPAGTGSSGSSSGNRPQKKWSNSNSNKPRTKSWR